MTTKKSSKTEHVLKLITKNQEGEPEELEESEMEEFEQFASEEFEDGEEAEAQESAPEAGVESHPEIEDMAARSKPSAAVLTLTEELKDEIKEKIKVELREETPSFLACEDSGGAKNLVMDVKISEADIKIEGTEAKPVNANGGFKPTQCAPMSAGTESRLINLAEDLARELAPEIMKRLNVCMCQACANDVLALALNALPQKYVTTESGKQFTKLLNFRNQYETDVVAALTRACVRIKASPRHPIV